MVSSSIEVFQQYENTGELPFPYGENWVAQLADLSWSAFRRLVHLNADFSIARTLLEDFSKLPLEDWFKTMSSPAVISWITESQKKSILTELDWLALKLELETDSGAILLHPASPLVLWSTPTETMRRRMKISASGDLSAPAEAAEFLAPDSPEFAQQRDAVTEGLQLIKELAPGYFSDANNFLRAIALVNDQANFRASSSVGRFGLVWYSPRPDWIPAVWAEEIVHETTHNLLDTLAARNPLLLGDNLDAPVHKSPLRPEPRPIGAVFHALVVSARLLAFFDKLENSRYSYDGLKDKQLLIKQRGRDVISSFATAASFSPMGQFIFEKMILTAFE